MASEDTERHSKTLGNYPKLIFSTLASTLVVSGCRDLDLCRASATIWTEAEVQFKSILFRFEWCGRVLKHPRNILSSAESDACGVRHCLSADLNLKSQTDRYKLSQHCRDDLLGVFDRAHMEACAPRPKISSVSAR